MAIWDTWVPGVLSRDQLIALAERDHLTGIDDPESIDDHSSFDLHLTLPAFQLTRGSVKPFGYRFLHSLNDAGLATPFEPDAAGYFDLAPRQTYLFGVREALQDLRGVSIYGQATAKSSVGRVDVLVRLIVEGADRYEGFQPDVLGTTRTAMFIEVTPITFAVRVKEGVALTQLRLFYGSPESCLIAGEEVCRTCFAGNDKDNNTLTVDLSTVDIEGVAASGFCATTPASDRPPISLWSEADDRPAPNEWWSAVQPDPQRLRIAHDRFYILRSAERLTVPPGVAVYARAVDEEIGEMRIHYAGFVHPTFGWDRTDGLDGTPLIFEVRGHNVDVSLRDREVLAKLQFYRMSEDPDGVVDQSYNDQELQLSKFFQAWDAPPTVLSEM